MTTYIIEFGSLAAQFERMGSEAMIMESHNAHLLLASTELTFQLHSTMSAFETMDSVPLTWENVTSNLFQAWNQVKAILGKDTKNLNITTNCLSSSLNQRQHHGYHLACIDIGNQQAYHSK